MTAFAHFAFRAARCALRTRQGGVVSQRVVGVYGDAQFVKACRGYAAAAFERNKPHVNIGAYCLQTK